MNNDNNNELDTLYTNHNDGMQQSSASPIDVIKEKIDVEDISEKISSVSKPLIFSYASSTVDNAAFIALFFTAIWSFFGAFNNKPTTYWLVLGIALIVSTILSIISISSSIRLYKNLPIIKRIVIIAKIIVLCIAYTLVFIFVWSFYTNH